MKTMKKKSSAPYTVRVTSDFTAVGVKSPDAKYRISIGGRIAKFNGKNVKVDAYQVFVNDDGDILLRPTVNIPAREAWIYEDSSVLDTVRKGLREAKEGKVTKVENIEKFIEKL